MSEVLDPTPTYLLVIGVLVATAAAAGWFAAGSVTAMGAGIIAIVLGFVAGAYASREEAEWFGSLLFTAALTGIMVSFLPLTLGQGLSLFLLGFVFGLRTERH
ncbi:MAG: hypothetical protein ABEK12_00110 [Candidatus Nanohaloarchaea archaeon]